MIDVSFETTVRSFGDRILVVHDPCGTQIYEGRSLAVGALLRLMLEHLCEDSLLSEHELLLLQAASETMELMARFNRVPTVAEILQLREARERV